VYIQGRHWRYQARKKEGVSCRASAAANADNVLEFYHEAADQELGGSRTPSFLLVQDASVVSYLLVEDR